MAGVSDAPFRQVCQSMGAGLTTSEMLTANTGLWHSRKSSLRLLDAVDCNNRLPRSIQIAGSDPASMAEAARQCVDMGAEIVDINMGCPAKKVCSKAAGSALLRDEKLVADIISAVVNAVAVPVTLKIRTGWCQASRNGTRVARIAEQNGISALTVHGRTRACRFAGEAEYETIAAIVETVDIPVIANGDINSPQKARQVLQTTGANAVMIGRAVQGQPWLIREIDHHLKWNTLSQKPSLKEVFKVVSEHVQALYNFYGDFSGVRIARKHLKWYSQRLIELCCRNTDVNDHVSYDQAIGGQTSHLWRLSPYGESLQQQVQTFISVVNKSESPDQQQASVRELFERLITREDIAA
jgi:tRNA-dihydrouridine synthase B